jgi:8-oxo-dGTP pyrophosphatase MutT (NUDIX family)
MQVEKGVIIVAYKQSRRSKRYALLKRQKNWEGWETPKGHLENDDYRETVKIELKEEAGIPEEKIKSIEDMDETVSWTYEQDGEKYKKEYKAFIAELEPETEIDISQNPCNEHSQGFFLKKTDAESLITYENNQKILEKAAEQIESQ